MSVGSLLKEGSHRLVSAGYHHGEREATAILADLFQHDSAWLIANDEEPVDAATEEIFMEKIDRRAQGEPLAYILGHQNFFGWDLLADTRALIPRPETEQLVEKLIRLIRAKHLETGQFLEVGTGSGAVSLILKKYFPNAQITATDISEDALEQARENAKRLKVEVDFVESDLMKDVPKQEFDLIVANLPYVPSPKLDFVSEQILDWEPMVAIDGGEDGLKYIRPFLETVAPYLADEGVLAIEMWHTHGQPVRKLIAKNLPGYKVKIEQDLAGFDRFVLTI